MAGLLSEPMEGAIHQGFVDRLPDLIAALSPTVIDVPQTRRQWVFYGSMPLGASRNGSDVDALLLHDGGSGHEPHRRSGSWGSTPVTIYVLSHRDLEDDGLPRRFGGYFTLKLFSPFVTDLPELDRALSERTARFLGPLSGLIAAGKPNAAWGVDELLAHAYLAFLDLYPDFAGYVARLVRDRALLTRVWEHQRRVHVDALLTTGYIAPADNGLWTYTGITPVTDPDRERARCAARFWAFGAVCHAADPGFPDVYFGKTDSHASSQEQTAARAFLQAMADGGGAI